jgi:hypothetical protein
MSGFRADRSQSDADSVSENIFIGPALLDGEAMHGDLKV